VDGTTLTLSQVRAYEEMLAECVRVLKPQGYLLVVEIEWVVSCLTGEEAESHLPMCHKSVRTARYCLHCIRNCRLSH
jgi:ubiquinone/menaquinone biosynthesis C-methylase UbiE